MTDLPPDILAFARLIRSDLDPKVKLLAVQGEGCDLNAHVWQSIDDGDRNEAKTARG